MAQGYAYPLFGRHADMPQLAGHHGIPDALVQQDALPSGLQSALEQLPDDCTVIFSSENFAHLQSEQVRSLVRALGVENVDIIYYARNWDHLLPSVWHELIKHGLSQPYLEFLNHQTSAPLASFYLNYKTVLDRWGKVTGAKRLRIFSYDNIRATGQDIVQHFCNQVLGIDLELTETRQENSRYSVGYTETLRMLNWLAFGGKVGSPKIRMALEQKHQKVQEDLAVLEEIYAPYICHARLCAPFVFPYVEQQVLKAYGHRVENLTEDGRLFSDRRILTSPYVHPNYLLEEGVGTCLRNVFRAII